MIERKNGIYIYYRGPPRSILYVVTGNRGTETEGDARTYCLC